MKIRKAIIPIAGSGTRFLPLSRVLPKEIWPLADKPIIQYIVEEAITSGIEEIIFVVKPEQRMALNYFKEKIDLDKYKNKNYKEHFLPDLKNLKKLLDKVSFSYAIQKEPRGDGHAILQAEKLVKNEPCAVLFGDDVIDGKPPCLKQLMDVFTKYRQPVITLYKVPRSEFNFYGMVDARPVANRIYQINRIVEKPKPEQSPSNLAIVGKYIITPAVFSFLKKNPPSERNEIGLAEAFRVMLAEHKEIYGCAIKGNWLECGNKLAYLKSNLYFSLKDPRFKKELKNYLKNCR